MDGSFFCAECGESLVSSPEPKKSTASLHQRVRERLQQTPPEPPSQPLKPNCEIDFVVLRTGRRLMLAMNKELLVGRCDKTQGIYPDIDLEPDGGYDAGISRQHAILALENGTCVVRDLESTNGTLVNGRPVLPHQAVPVSNGDKLTFGDLTLLVELGEKP